MKKLLALLMACATITCAFASCGDEKEESSANKTSVSESSDEAEETEATTEEASEEETTEAETTTEDSAETESDTSAVEKTTYEFIEDADKTAFLGKWECTKLVVEGEEMEDLMGLPLYAVFQLEIKEDGTASMAEAVAELSESEEAVTYTWGVVSDTEIAIVDSNDNSMLLTLDGDYLIGTEEGYDEQLYLAKVDEFTPFDFESFMNDFQMEGTEGAEGASDTETTSDSELSTGEEETSEAVEGETSEAVEGESAESVAPSAE